jgi:hypothetical protein
LRRELGFLTFSISLIIFTVITSRYLLWQLSPLGPPKPPQCNRGIVVFLADGTSEYFLVGSY